MNTLEIQDKVETTAEAIRRHVKALQELLAASLLAEQKSQSIPLRIEPSRKRLFQLLAELKGESVSEYLLNSAMERALQDLEELQKGPVLSISDTAFLHLQQAVEEPARLPSIKAQALLASYRSQADSKW